jgi:hypothetical protein
MNRVGVDARTGFRLGRKDFFDCFSHRLCPHPASPAPRRCQNRF